METRTTNQPESLQTTLQTARKSKRLSQLELALRMGVSQRHVSFVESGRARPSRELLLSWLHELQAPLALRNVALQQAGFAPVYRGSELADAVLAHMRDDASVVPGILPRVEQLAQQMQQRLGKRVLSPWPRQMAPVLTTRFATRHGELAFFSMFSTFGTPQDITLASLRVEHVFPADEATRAVLTAQLSQIAT